MSEFLPDGAAHAALCQGTVNVNLLKRLVLVLAGLFFVLLGAVGVFLPGLPTAGPLILASICLTKSSPWLERKLVRSRFFAAFHQYLDGGAKIPRRARVIAIVMMWISIGVSATLLLTSGRVAIWFVGLVLFAGVIGTVVIIRYGHRRAVPAIKPGTKPESTSKSKEF